MPGRVFGFRFFAFTVLFAFPCLQPLDVRGQRDEGGVVELTVRSVPAGRLDPFRKSFRSWREVVWSR